MEALSALDRWQEKPFKMPDLQPGMVVAVAMDLGPSGVCGQCMSITCPWQYLHLFPSESAYREYVSQKPLGRKGQGYREAYAVVGSHGTGHMHIVNHCNQEPQDA